MYDSSRTTQFCTAQDDQGTASVGTQTDTQQEHPEAKAAHI